MMRIDSDQWGEIMESLSRNKTRTILTAFGIFWGVFMLMVLMGGGTGLKLQVADIFAGVAQNSGILIAQPTSKPYHGFQVDRRWKLNMTDVERIRNTFPEVEVCEPCITFYNRTASFQERKSVINLQSFTPGFNRIQTVHLSEGRLINDVDLKLRRKVCIIGKRVREELFPDSIPALGCYVECNGVQYQVVGVNSRGGNGISLGGNPMNMIQVPYTTLTQVYNQEGELDFLAYTVKENYPVDEMDERIQAMLKRVHHISPDDNMAIESVNLKVFFTFVDSIFKGISLLVWMIGLGTLLAGAIGVSNIMMVTVRERTGEIGIRRALGATPTDIMVQTMSESLVLTLLSGMTGICLSVFVLYFVEQSAPDMGTAAQASYQVPFWTAIGATLLLSVLGVLAGLAPTWRAMAVKPVDAMREE